MIYKIYLLDTSLLLNLCLLYRYISEIYVYIYTYICTPAFVAKSERIFIYLSKLLTRSYIFATTISPKVTLYHCLGHQRIVIKE